MGTKSVAVCDGQGLSVKVARGHLVISNTGSDPQTYTRAGHGLERIVILGRSGSLSLAAIDWCSKLGIPIVQIRPDGEILWTSAYGPGGLRVDDGRLVRAQALAGAGPVGIDICHDLLEAKIEGSADVAERQLSNPDLARHLRQVARAEIRGIRLTKELQKVEGSAAQRYFEGWRDIPIRFCAADRDRVPKHWLAYSARGSKATKRNSPRGASDPINAMLNYLYTIAGSESRLAIMALGLEPTLGFLHLDTPRTQTLVWDLIEPVRPIIDTWLLALLRDHTFTASDFIETPIGSCRIAEPLSHVLAATGPLWYKAIAPHAEQMRNAIAESSPYKIDMTTRLTNTNQRQSKGQRQYRPVSWLANREAYPEPHSCGRCEIAA